MFRTDLLVSSHLIMYVSQQQRHTHHHFLMALTFGNISAMNISSQMLTTFEKENKGA